MPRRLMVAGGVVAGLALVTAIAGFALAAVRSDEVVPGVVVEDLAVGGLGEDAVRAAVADLAAERSAEGVTFTYEDETYPVDPVAVGVAVDVDAAVEELLAVGRDGAFVGDRLNALFGVEEQVDLPVALDEDALAARVAAIAATVDAEVSPGSLEIDEVSLTVEPVPPVVGVEVDQQAAIDAVVAAVEQPGAEELPLPVTETEPDTDDGDVEAVAAAARAAIDEDLTLTSDDGSVTLAPRDVAALLDVEPVGSGDDATLRLVVSADAVQEVVVPVADPLLREPRNASYDAPKRPGVTFDDKLDTTWSPRAADVDVIDGRTGTEVSTELAAEQLTEAVRAADRTVDLELAEIEPDLSTEQARELRPNQLLSTFTTYHACCATRVANIQRLADMVDETLVLPGKQFSINQISGVRECSKGFKAAGMILDGEIVDSCGGGVSQFGTTTINAVFFAGLDPDAYKPHSFYISRYPMAREATLNFPSPDIDVKFTNDTGAPIIVRTAYTGTSITVSFYGRSDVESVSADVGSPRNYRSFSTRRRVNRNLPAGASRTVQGGQDGFSVSLTRTIRREGGEVTTDDWSNTYVPEIEIVEYNPDEPKPKPSPSPSPTPKPSPTASTTPSPAPSEPDTSPSPDA